MEIISFKMKVNSYFISEIWSDQLWGEVAWAIKFLKGDSVFKNFLDQYKTAEKEEDFPMIFSSIFPYNYFPIPVIGYNLSEFLENDKNYSKMKKIKKAGFIKKDFFLKMLDNLNANSIKMEEFYQNILKGNEIKTDILHNTIDRITGAGLEGGLFVQEQQKTKEDKWFFVKINQSWKDILFETLKYLEIKGIGGDSSTGAGQIEIVEKKYDFTKTWTNESERYISLSHSVSKHLDTFHTVTKYGKLYKKVAKTDNPFKQPVIMTEPGAILNNFAKESLKDGIIKKIHRNKDIIHYAIPFLIPTKREV